MAELSYCVGMQRSFLLYIYIYIYIFILANIPDQAQTVNPITFCHIVKETGGQSANRIDLCSLIRRYGDIRSDNSCC